MGQSITNTHMVVVNYFQHDTAADMRELGAPIGRAPPPPTRRVTLSATCFYKLGDCTCVLTLCRTVS